ncbi:chemotaxis protein CheW [Megalodesulfovibrio gigas]|uniref:Putative CheW protein n=1 Tax=Megalodesulfovibrio gigas (strain ATCC 19364 / DSM 1382 / NCIMB 9332 / VKM B-1759) TaxID=1121448 RepID=T2G6X2_MEGG1|nr:chemotaxis protein CheW [Megalodesulfovibrio gigas]AGW12340.1 putative CheW protein [Megalodesulfovibrio gigas DSM 1382 = ATCC 19364]
MSETLAQLNQHLTFTLGGEQFACNIASVREILDAAETTRIPMTPPYMRGVINVRGHAVPVVDLRVKFGMETAPDTVNTCVIIAEVTVGAEAVLLGALADSVQEVLEIPQDTISPPPRLGASIDTRFMTGMARMGERFCILLDLNAVFSVDELAEVAACSQAA